MLCDSATPVAIAITSRLNSDNSMPGWPCVTPSHIAGTPPANCATAPASRAACLISVGKFSNGRCADSMSLYAETIAMFGQRTPRSAAFSGASMPANPCARFVHDSVARVAPAPRACSIRSRYAARESRLRSRIRSVTIRTRSCSGAAAFNVGNLGAVIAMSRSILNECYSMNAAAPQTLVFQSLRSFDGGSLRT